MEEEEGGREKALFSDINFVDFFLCCHLERRSKAM